MEVKVKSKLKFFLIAFFMLGLLGKFTHNVTNGENKKIKNEAVAMIEKGDLSQATKLLEEIKDDNYSKKISQEISVVNDNDTKFNFLGELSDEDFKKLKNNELVINKFSHPNLNKIFLNNVLKIENIDEVKKNRTALIEKKKFDEKINSYFSMGSHNLVTEYLKKNLNDTKSYKHIETKYAVSADKKTMSIYQKFKVENDFGGMAPLICVATQDLNTGELTSIKIEQL